MEPIEPLPQPLITRRRLFKAGFGAAAGVGLYSTGVSRHWLETTHHDIRLQGLHPAFEGMRIAQVSDIHLDEFTEPLFLRFVVDRVNALNPDMVLLTGDYVSFELATREFAVGSAWQCAQILKLLTCKQVFSILGNHDVSLDSNEVTTALRSNGIPVLVNASIPIERNGGRFWLAGIDDPVAGDPDPEKTIPVSIRNIANEPVILMCHAPDYVDDLLQHPAGKAVDFVMCGHTHGGQVRLPFIGAMQLPVGGKRYVEGLFKLGDAQLYVNRGIGTVGVPFRLDCPPEISVFTLRSA